MRIGIGYDIHALKKGRKLLLGGIEIPYSKGLEGHSDGDALLHAVLDAALGAAGMGDIGDHFSDRDPRFKNADSRLFAKEILAQLKKKGFRVDQIDTIVIAQEPKLYPFKEKMRQSLAKIFAVPPDRVGLKAKTHEGFGAIGRGEAIACQAAVVLQKSSKKTGKKK